MPGDVGTLEVVIRDIVQADMDELLRCKERSISEGTESEDMESEDTESEGTESEGTEPEEQDEGCLRLDANLQDDPNDCENWQDPKPRHTHHTEYVKTNTCQLNPLNSVTIAE